MILLGMAIAVIGFIVTSYFGIAFFRAACKKETELAGFFAIVSFVGVFAFFFGINLLF